MQTFHKNYMYILQTKSHFTYVTNDTPSSAIIIPSFGMKRYDCIIRGT